MLQHPAERQLRQGVAARNGEIIETLEFLQKFWREVFFLEGSFEADARIGRDAVQIAIGQHALRQRGERHETGAFALNFFQNAFFNGGAVEQVKTTLIAQTRHIAAAQILKGELRGLEGPAGDAHIERLALANNVHQRLKGFLQGSLRVIAVGIEEVDIIQFHALQTLVERGNERFPAAPVPIRPGPHFVAGFRGDEEFVAIGFERRLHDFAKRLFGTSGRRPVVVGQVEMYDAVVESVVNQRAAFRQRALASEVFPEAERDGRQKDAAFSATAIGWPVLVAVGGCQIWLFFI